MPDTIELTQLLPDGSPSRPVYRRLHRKADGRDLFLYGYSRHEESALAEEPGTVATGATMRRHPLRGDWAIHAGHRQNRTHLPGRAANPLAPSREGGPATEIPFTGFELAIFENRFPSLHPEAPTTDPADSDQMAAHGRCEVIVYGPDPDVQLSGMQQEQRELLVHAYIDRYRALFAAGHAYVLPFENRGIEIGATLHHPHGQIYGFPLVPGPQQNAAAAFAAGYDLAADLEAWGDSARIAENSTMIAFVPPYMRFPYEGWIAPKRACAGPWAFTAGEITDFAAMMGEMQRRYDGHFGRVPPDGLAPYMMSLHAAPNGHEGPWHFTCQYYPMLRDAERLKHLASVEQATGIFTVDIDPRAAAQALRTAI